MKKIVFLTGNYYPNHSAVSNCVEKVANELSDKFEVTVLTLKNNYKDCDEENYKKHKIIRIDFSNGIDDKKQIFKRRVKRVKSKYSLNEDIIDAYTSKLDEMENIDIIIPASMPFETVVSANNYKIKNAETLLVPYLFDPYVENENLFYNIVLKKIKSKSAKKLESVIVKNADKIILLNHLKNYFEKNYADYERKFEFVEHPLLIPNIIINKEKKPGEKVNFVYTGSFYKKIRSPKKLIRVFKLVTAELKSSKLNIYSFGDCEKILKQETGENEYNIDLNGTVSLNESQLKMKEADFLIAVGNTTSSQSPSKIFEYMSFGKPIIYFLNNSKDSNLTVLSKYPLSLVIDNNLSDIEAKNKIIKYLEEVENLNSKINIKKTLELFNDATPSYTSYKIEKFLHK